MISLDFFAIKLRLFFKSGINESIIINEVWNGLEEFFLLDTSLFEEVIKGLDNKFLINVTAICSRLFIIIKDNALHTVEAFYNQF